MPDTRVAAQLNRNYLFGMRFGGRGSRVEFIENSAVDAPEFNTTDVITVARNERTPYGKIVRRLVPVKGGTLDDIQFNVMLPPGQRSSRLDRLARQEGATCTYDLYFYDECSEDVHFLKFTDTMFQVKQLTNSLIVVSDDEEPAQWQVPVRASRMLEYEDLILREVYSDTAAQSDNIAGIVFTGANCTTCEDGTDILHQTGYIFGDDGEATPGPMIKYTSNGFGTFTNRSANIPGGAGSDDVVAAYADGNFAIFLANDATDSEIIVTTDNGASMSLANKSGTSTTAWSSVILRDVFYANGYYYAVGDEIWRSVDGFTWTQVTIPSGITIEVYAGAWDEVNNTIYLVGEDGSTNGRVVTLQNNGFLDITTTALGGATETVTLQTISVLSPGHIITGGTGGAVYENVDVYNESWALVTIPGATGTVVGIGGDSDRIVAWVVDSSSGDAYEKSLLKGERWTPVESQFGFTVGAAAVGMAVGATYNGANNFVMASAKEVFTYSPRNVAA